MTRVDALRNRARVVEAATAVFAEQGVDAGVDVVASRAGVGKATVYRSFPTKEHLVAAVAVQRLTWFAERAEAAAAEPDALAAFEDLMLAIAEAQAGDRVLAGSLATAVGKLPDYVAARDRAQAALDRLMARASAAGGLRPDATADEVRVLFAGVCRVLADEGVNDPAVWRRYARLVVAAVSS